MVFRGKKRGVSQLTPPKLFWRPHGESNPGYRRERKPYEPRELVLRIESILKRNSTKSFKVADFTIDKDNRAVLIDDYAIDFTKIEFEIFIYLVENKNKISSREQILNASSLDFNTKNRTIDMHISNIRAKIGDDSKNPKYIKSVWGIGYKFVG